MIHLRRSLAAVLTAITLISCMAVTSFADTKDGWTEEDGYRFYYAGGKRKKGWLLYESEWYYLDPYDGHMHSDTGLKIGGKWYYFGMDGVMLKKQWVIAVQDTTVNGEVTLWAYVGKNGEAYQGWHKMGGKWYYFWNSFALAGCTWKIGNKNYVFGADGAMATKKWVKYLYDSEYELWFYANGSGIATTGWKKLSGKWYYFDADGVMERGLCYIDRCFYFFDEDGVMVTDTWYNAGSEDEKLMMYFGPEGHDLVGWKQLDGKWYFFDHDGIMLHDTVVDGYKLGPDGVWIK